MKSPNLCEGHRIRPRKSGVQRHTQTKRRLFFSNRPNPQEEFHRKQQAIAMRNGKNVKHELPRKNVAADLASAGELAWVKALENASLGPQGN